MNVKHLRSKGPPTIKRLTTANLAKGDTNGRSKKSINEKSKNLPVANLGIYKTNMAPIMNKS